jgi:hypothetical protein
MTEARVSTYLECDYCHEMEHVDHVKTVQVDPITNQGRSKCRRCRLPARAREAWDALRAAETAVRAAPEDYAVLETLRARRVDFRLALNPPKPGEPSHPRAG